MHPVIGDIFVVLPGSVCVGTSHVGECSAPKITIPCWAFWCTKETTGFLKLKALFVRLVRCRAVFGEVKAGTKIQEVGGKVYYIIHCYHQNCFHTEMASDESHLKASLVVRGNTVRQRPKTPTFEEKGEMEQGIKPMSVYQAVNGWAKLAYISESNSQ